MSNQQSFGVAAMRSPPTLHSPDGQTASLPPRHSVPSRSCPLARRWSVELPSGTTPRSRISEPRRAPTSHLLHAASQLPLLRAVRTPSTPPPVQAPPCGCPPPPQVASAQTALEAAQAEANMARSAHHAVTAELAEQRRRTAAAPPPLWSGDPPVLILYCPCVVGASTGHSMNPPIARTLATAVRHNTFFDVPPSQMPTR